MPDSSSIGSGFFDLALCGGKELLLFRIGGGNDLLSLGFGIIYDAVMGLACIGKSINDGFLTIPVFVKPALRACKLAAAGIKFFGRSAAD